MKFTIGFEGVAVGPGGQRLDRLQDHLDLVMEELLRLAVEDPSIGATGKTGEVEISVTVEADDLDTALTAGGTAIRSAIHAAGGSTPDWSVDWCSAYGRRIELASTSA